MISSGEIVDDEKAELQKLVLEVINHPMLQIYYVQGSEVYNERDIITDSGQILRPDRLNIKDAEALIIDYKTGIEDKKHEQQLQLYQDALEDMNLIIKKKILIYINDDIKIKDV
mgnify:CR=1 FL=1